MPAKFHLVSPGVWDRRLRGVSVEAKVVAFNVWTNRVRASEGLYELSPGHIAADTGLTAEAVTGALDELHRAGIIGYDHQAEVVLDRLALKTNPLRSERDKRIPNAVELYERVAASPLKDEFLQLAEQHSPALANAIRQRLGPGLEQPLASTSEGPSEDLAREGPSEDLARTQQGPSRDETSRDEQIREEPSRVESKVERCEVCGESLSPDWCTCGKEARIRQQTEQMRKRLAAQMESVA